MTVALDGTAWFLSQLGVNRITPTAAVTTFNNPNLYRYNDNTDVALGPDKALWFTSSCGLVDPVACNQSLQVVSRITTAGSLTTTPVEISDNTHGIFPTRLTSGPGNNLWGVGQRFGAGLGSLGGQYLSFTPSATVVFRNVLPLLPPFPTCSTNGFLLYDGNGITEGADGAIYIAADSNGTGCPYKVFRVNAAGKITNGGGFTIPVALPSSGFPFASIASGPDGNLWIGFVDSIVRMTTTGATTVFHTPTANSGVSRIIAGNDGAMWFTEFNASKIGRITTAGVITEYPTPTAHAGPYGIASLAGQCSTGHGRIWFTEMNANKIGRIDF